MVTNLAIDIYFVTAVFLVIVAQICASQTDAACPCTREYRPLCGSDGITYNNPCLLRCAAFTSRQEIKIAKSVPCDEPIQERNNCVCAYNYSPVCGSDGQTYANKCDLNCHRVFDQYLVFKHSGVCETTEVTDEKKQVTL